MSALCTEPCRELTNSLLHRERRARPRMRTPRTGNPGIITVHTAIFTVVLPSLRSAVATCALYTRGMVYSLCGSCLLVNICALGAYPSDDCSFLTLRAGNGNIRNSSYRTAISMIASCIHFRASNVRIRSQNRNRKRNAQHKRQKQSKEFFQGKSSRFSFNCQLLLSPTATGIQLPKTGVFQSIAMWYLHSNDRTRSIKNDGHHL